MTMVKDIDQLCEACRKGNLEVVTALLLEKGALVNEKDEWGWKPLHCACSRGHLDIVNLLIKKGAEVNMRISVGSAPLHYACSGGHLEVIDFLIEKGADIDARTDGGCTPLHYACSKERLEVIRLLLEHEAKVEYDSEGKIIMKYISIKVREFLDDYDDGRCNIKPALRLPSQSEY